MEMKKKIHILKSKPQAKKPTGAATEATVASVKNVPVKMKGLLLLDSNNLLLNQS